MRVPAGRRREADQLGEASTNVPPGTAVARERHQEDATRPDDADDLGEGIPPPGDQLEDPPGVCCAERPVAERRCCTRPPCTSGIGNRPPAFSTSTSIIGRVNRQRPIGIPAPCNGSPSCPVPIPTSNTSAPAATHLVESRSIVCRKPSGAVPARAVVEVPRRDRTRPNLSMGPDFRTVKGLQPLGQVERPLLGRELRLDRTSEVAEPLDEPGAQRPRRRAASSLARPPRPAVLPILDAGEERLHGHRPESRGRRGACGVTAPSRAIARTQPTPGRRGPVLTASGRSPASSRNRSWIS